MKNIIPSPNTCDYVEIRLRTFFDHPEEPWWWRGAILQLCQYYGEKVPKVVWDPVELSGDLAGRCSETGIVQLISPDRWKKNRKYNSRAHWVSTVLHELGHYLFWANAERKADAFARDVTRAANRCRRGV